MACKIGRTIYVIVQFVAFIFVLVGTPIDMFRSHQQDMFGNTPCLTLWGEKSKCYSTVYNIRPKALFAACNDRLKRWQAAEAFAIISIAVFGVAFLFGAVSLFCMNCLRWICLLLNIVGVVSAVVVVALMADAYNNSSGVLCGALKTLFKFGAGFGLYVVAWILNLLNIVPLMVSR